MIRSVITIAVSLFFGLSASTLLAQETKPSLQSMAFIAGCWEKDSPEKKRLVSEQWMSPVGDAMLGMSRTIRDGKLSGFEHLRIIQAGTDIFYISKPSENKEETAFKLVKWAANEVTFENPTHDFPQRIIYKLTGTDKLSARIEGTSNGKPMGIDFPYVRSKCG